MINDEYLICIFISTNPMRNLDVLLF